MEELQYPIGRFKADPETSAVKRAGWINDLERVPENLRQAVSGLSASQLDTPYRPGGWTVRQVVHHIADSNMNSYIRFRLGLTEDTPTIKPYEENGWAALLDSRTAPLDPSFQILDGLHSRWIMFLRAMTEADFARIIVHPESGRLTLDMMLQLYVWHSHHHIAHITRLRERNGWQVLR